MDEAVEQGLDCARLPAIATVARLLCRELTLQNEYLRLENRILKEEVTGTNPVVLVGRPGDRLEGTSGHR